MNTTSSRKTLILQANAQRSAESALPCSGRKRQHILFIWRVDAVTPSILSARCIYTSKRNNAHVISKVTSPVGDRLIRTYTLANGEVSIHANNKAEKDRDEAKYRSVLRILLKHVQTQR